jgi:predicted DNA-binding transcriptional regulator AlpA
VFKSQVNHKPTERLIRLGEVLSYLPVARSTWWSGVRSGRFPSPVKLGPHTPCWRLTDIIELAERGIKTDAQRGGQSRARVAAD